MNPLRAVTGLSILPLSPSLEFSPPHADPPQTPEMNHMDVGEDSLEKRLATMLTHEYPKVNPTCGESLSNICYLPQDRQSCGTQEN